jgi:hypothetical protein
MIIIRRNDLIVIINIIFYLLIDFFSVFLIMLNLFGKLFRSGALTTDKRELKNARTSRE